MKHIISHFNFWNFFIGGVIGFVVAIFLFSFLVPTGLDMARVYNIDRYKNMKKEPYGMAHTYHMSNPYMMSAVTSEKQFLEDMILHHEAALTMAQQVLTLSPRDTVKKLAEDIVSAQTKEIATMKEWLKGWK